MICPGKNCSCLCPRIIVFAKVGNKNTHNGLYVEVPPRGTDWKPHLWAKLPFFKILDVP
jgi:hypothetical protein